MVELGIPSVRVGLGRNEALRSGTGIPTIHSARWLETAIISGSSLIFGKGGVDAHRAMTTTGVVEFTERISS